MMQVLKIWFYCSLILACSEGQKDLSNGKKLVDSDNAKSESTPATPNISINPSEADSSPQPIPPKIDEKIFSEYFSRLAPTVDKFDWGISTFRKINPNGLVIKLVNISNETLRGVRFFNYNTADFPFHLKSPGSCLEAGNDGASRYVPIDLKPGQTCSQILYFEPKTAFKAYLSTRIDVYANEKVIGSVVEVTGTPEIKVSNAVPLVDDEAVYNFDYAGHWLFANPSGTDMVLHRAVVSVVNDQGPMTNAGVAKAAMDICIDVSVPQANGQGRMGTFTGVEVLCVNQTLVNTLQFPKPTWDIVFPEQGQYVDITSRIKCASHILVKEAQSWPGQNLSSLSCDFYFRPIGWDATKSVVRSIRMPYLDEMFHSETARTTFHTNKHDKPLEIVSFWPYVFAWDSLTTISKYTTAKFFHIGADGATLKTWEFPLIPHSTGAHHSPNKFFPFEIKLSKGQELGSSCLLSTLPGKELPPLYKDCGFFVFVKTSLADQKTGWGTAAATIKASRACEYCRLSATIQPPDMQQCMQDLQLRSMTAPASCPIYYVLDPGLLEHCKNLLGVADQC